MFREIPKNSKLAEIRDYYLFYRENPAEFLQYRDGNTIPPGGGYFSGHVKPFAETIGEKTLGAGAFSTCITFGEAYTIKLNTREDNSYKEYVKFCLQNQGLSGLPIIHYVGEWNDTFVVLLDRLQKVEPFHYGICAFLENEKEYTDGPENYIQARVDFNRINKARERLNKGSFWARTLKRTKAREYIEDDLQPANIMLKGEQFIFTDPWS